MKLLSSSDYHACSFSWLLLATLVCFYPSDAMNLRYLCSYCQLYSVCYAHSFIERIDSATLLRQLQATPRLPHGSLQPESPMASPRLPYGSLQPESPVASPRLPHGSLQPEVTLVVMARFRAWISSSLSEIDCGCAAWTVC